VIAPPTCPICEKPLAAEVASKSPTFPFCSERCRQIDLLRWSKGQYRIVEPLNPREIEQETSTPEE
jgi:uncharacterized protein